MTRIVYSFSTEPLRIQCYDTNNFKKFLYNIWYCALANAYAKLNGAYTICHTDSLGYTLLQYIPYDEIKISLDNLYEDGIHPRFWAYAKIKALQLEDVGAIHTDFDVFLKTKSIIDYISKEDYDCIVQSLESNVSWYDKEKIAFKGLYNEVKTNGIDINHNDAYNTGVLGFKNKDLKDKFINTYINIAKIASKHSKDILDNNNYVTPDLIAEQLNIHYNTKDYDVKCILNSNNIKDEANKVGFQHVLTQYKYVDDNINKVKKLVKKYDIETFNKLIKICK